MPEPDPEFIIPKEFLERLREYSDGGYILLTFSDKGNPIVYRAYETRKDQLALESAFLRFADKLEQEQLDDEEDDDEE